jgi:hypothetical protein
MARHPTPAHRLARLVRTLGIIYLSKTEIKLLTFPKNQIIIKLEQSFGIVFHERGRVL